MAEIRLKQRQAIEVEWEDINDYSDDDWNDDPDYYTTSTIYTRGFVAFDFDGGSTLRVSRDFDVDGKPRGVRCIPFGCVTSVWDMERGALVYEPDIADLRYIPKE